jgi:hypothetical protein
MVGKTQRTRKRGVPERNGVSETTVLDRLLEPVVGCFSKRLAQRLVDLRADQDTQRRLDELAAKANEGELTAPEEREYEAYVHAIDLIGILQAKARRYLRRHANG